VVAGWQQVRARARQCVCGLGLGEGRVSAVAMVGGRRSSGGGAAGWERARADARRKKHSARIRIRGGRGRHGVSSWWVAWRWQGRSAAGACWCESEEEEK
jgi:hypothetical protein